MLKPFNTKLDERQIEYKEDIISPEFTKLVDNSLRQNIKLLKKLSNKKNSKRDEKKR